MKITFKYFAQSRQLAGQDTESIEVNEGINVIDALTTAAEKYGDAFKTLVLEDSGNIRPSIMVLLNEAPIPHGENPVLSEGNVISIFSPVAGG